MPLPPNFAKILQYCWFDLEVNRSNALSFYSWNSLYKAKLEFKFIISLWNYFKSTILLSVYLALLFLRIHIWENYNSGF